MSAMAFFLTLLAAVNVAVAYLWLCQRALEKSLSSTRPIWPALFPVRRPVARMADERSMYKGGMLDPIETSEPALAKAVADTPAAGSPEVAAPAARPKAAPRARKSKA